MLQMKFTPDLHRVERRKMVRQLKKIWAVHHMLFISDSEAEIAAAVNVGIARLQKWKQSKEWEHAVAFWTGNANTVSIVSLGTDDEESREPLRKARKSLKAAERYWKQIIQEGYDLFPQGLEGFIEAHTYIRSEDEIPSNQMGLEALQPPPRFLWIHDITAALFAIGSLM